MARACRRLRLHHPCAELSSLSSPGGIIPHPLYHIPIVNRQSCMKQITALTLQAQAASPCLYCLSQKYTECNTRVGLSSDCTTSCSTSLQYRADAGGAAAYEDAERNHLHAVQLLLNVGRNRLDLCSQLLLNLVPAPQQWQQRTDDESHMLMANTSCSGKAAAAHACSASRRRAIG